MIDVSSPAPFVNAALLARYAGKTVRLVGKVGGDGAVTAADGQQVQVKGSGSYPCAFVEIEGVVDGPTTIREIKATPFGNNFGECLSRRGRRDNTPATWLTHLPPPPPPPPCASPPRTPPLPTRSPDMDSHNELCKLSNNEHSALFL